MNKSLLAIIACAVAAVSACCPGKVVESPEYPAIYPDYVGVTVPEGIAGLNFDMADGRCCKVVRTREGDTEYYEVTAWQKGADVATKYAKFPVYISSDEIDPYIAYRLIEPGYENWHDMGLYQRELASFKETPIATNQVNNRGCVNCHTFDSGNPDRFLFHARGTGGGTVFVDGDQVKKINLATIAAKKQGVYPTWHPGGRYIVFSSNQTFQRFSINDSQPIEVFDESSDLILFDTQTDSTTCIPGASEPDRLETFPGWSRDGKTLYWCCADGDSVGCEDRSHIFYRLMADDFDGESFSGSPRTVLQYDSASVSLPRIYGDWLLFTKSDYGTFPIWHREADLHLLNLATGECRAAEELNSPDTESFHNWSSNGRWVVFSSRRDDGRYTRLYIAHFDGEGHFGKPFMLPQKKAVYNQYRMQSYNVPDFTTGQVKDRQSQMKKLF